MESAKKPYSRRANQDVSPDGLLRFFTARCWTPECKLCSNQFAPDPTGIRQKDAGSPHISTSRPTRHPRWKGQNGGFSARAMFGKLNFSARRRIVTAGVPRVTLKNSNDGAIDSDDRPPVSNRFDRILATGRRKPTPGWKKRADPELVHPNQPNQ